MFPDCGFSRSVVNVRNKMIFIFHNRASTPSTEAIKSSMMDDISLEDVEQFEEARLAQVRRKVSRVDSLKKFLFSSRLEEKKTRNTAGRQWQRELSHPAVKTTIDSGTVGLH